MKKGKTKSFTKLKLIERIIKVSTNEWDLILDPFIGSWTTWVVAKNLWRNFIWFDTNIDYVNIANERIFNWKIIE